MPAQDGTLQYPDRYSSAQTRAVVTSNGAPCTAIPLATRSAHKRIARIGVAQKVSQSPLVSEVLPGSTAHETTPAVQPIYENCKSERGYGDFKVASDKVSLSNVQESVNVSFQMRERQRYRRRRNERQ